MTWFDFGVLIVLVVSVVISLFHGLAREMVSLGVWIGGFILATFFGRLAWAPRTARWVRSSVL
jgi:uncharacterized membrane protein required for colicin V production